MVSDRGNKSLTKYSLYNILFFWLALLVTLFVINKGFFSQKLEGAALSGVIFTDIASMDNSLQTSFGYYEKSSEIINSAMKYIFEVPKLLVNDEALQVVLGNLLITSVPYLFAFFSFLFLLNIANPEKILIGSIVNSSVISFTILASIISNNISSDAAIGLSSSQMASYAIVNSLVFLVIYFCAIRLFVKKY